STSKVSPRDERRSAAARPQALRAGHPGHAERRDHRGRGLRRVRRAGPRDRPERRRQRRRAGRGLSRGGRPGHPRLVPRREGCPGAEAERAALPGRQGGRRARARHVGRGAGRGPRAAGRRPRGREDAHERLLRDAPGHPPARPRGRPAHHHGGLDEHVDRAHRAPRRRRRLRGRRRLRRHVDHRRGVAERRAELRDDQRGQGRHLRGDQERAGLVSTLQSDLVLRQGYIDGAWVDADSGATFAVTNPASGEVVAQVPRMGAGETRRAIEAAQRALPGWRGMLAKERAAIMRRWADLMIDHQEDLAALLTTEQGKPLAESRVEIAYAASFLEWFGEEAKRVYGDTIPTYMRDRRIVVAKEPVGVTAGITPWNFPA